MRRLLLVVGALALALTCSVPAGASGQSVQSAVQRGGSNFSWYRLEGCDREPYATISSFHTAQTQVRASLAQLYDAGQRRLRIGIFHWRSATSGTVMSSAGGTLDGQNRANLSGFLQAVKQAGFVELEVAFHPIGANDPHGWTSWNESYYQENRALIADLRPLVAAAGIPYKLDLLNEGMPMTTEPTLRDYAKRLWADYTAAFGKADTVGFSMTVWIATGSSRRGWSTATTPRQPGTYGVRSTTPAGRCSTSPSGPSPAPAAARTSTPPRRPRTTPI